ncbi:hypothetical protein TNCV_4075531 [Trichonephila clavipes]|nr:hypothetical protein TNCV_4075531 [Trichonephila clavipes]
MEVGSSDSSGSGYQSSSFREDRPRLDQSQSFRNSESGERQGEQEKKTSLNGDQGGRPIKVTGDGPQKSDRLTKLPHHIRDFEPQQI